LTQNQVRKCAGSSPAIGTTKISVESGFL